MNQGEKITIKHVKDVIPVVGMVVATGVMAAIMMLVLDLVPLYKAIIIATLVLGDVYVAIMMPREAQKETEFSSRGIAISYRGNLMMEIPWSRISDMGMFQYKSHEYVYFSQLATEESRQDILVLKGGSDFGKEDIVSGKNIFWAMRSKKKREKLAEYPFYIFTSRQFKKEQLEEVTRMWEENRNW